MPSRCHQHTPLRPVHPMPSVWHFLASAVHSTIRAFVCRTKQYSTVQHNTVRYTAEQNNLWRRVVEEPNIRCSAAVADNPIVT